MNTSGATYAAGYNTILIYYFDHSVIILLDNVFLALAVLPRPPATSFQVRNQACNFLVAILLGLPLALEVQTGVLAGVYRGLPVHYRGLVVAVLLEELLDAVAAEEQRVLLHDLLVLPIVIIYMLLVEVVILGRWDVGRHQPLICEALPGEGLEPRVRFHFRVPVETQAVRRLALQTL